MESSGRSAQEKRTGTGVIIQRYCGSLERMVNIQECYVNELAGAWICEHTMDIRTCSLVCPYAMGFILGVLSSAAQKLQRSSSLASLPYLPATDYAYGTLFKNGHVKDHTSSSPPIKEPPTAPKTWQFWNPVVKLTKAAYRGDKGSVSRLLSAGMSSTTIGPRGIPVLCAAAEGGNLETVRCLIESGASVNDRDPKGWTPLYFAAKNGHDSIIELLLRCGANIDMPTYSGGTPLSIAAGNGHQRSIELLFDAGAAVDTRDNRGETPLHWAIQGGHKQIVEWLLDHGADIHARDIEGYTTLHKAMVVFGSRRIDKALVELLLRRGANLTATYLNFTPMGLVEISPKFMTTFLVKDNSVLEVLTRYEKQQKKV